MTKIVEAKAVISAADATGNVLDKIAQKFKGVEKSAKALEGIKAPKFTGDMFQELRRLNLSEKQLQGVRKEFEKFDSTLKSFRPRAANYFKAINEWQGNTVDHWRKVRVATDEAEAAQRRYLRSGAGLMRAAGGFLGAGAVGYYGGRAARFAFERSKDANRETTKQRQAGLTQAQSDAIAAAAEQQSRNFPSISQTEFRSAGREATMQLGSAEAGLRMMPTIGRFMTAGKVLWGSDKIDEQTRKALQVLDARQITDPARAESLLNALVKSSQVEGGPDFKADDLRTALRHGRDMTRGQSDRFITSVLPQLGVDMGYSQAGTGLASMHSALIGGRQTDAAAEFQRKAGLRDDGGIAGRELFSRDVDRWFDEHLIPAMKRAGVDTSDPAAVAGFNAKFFSNRTAADVAGNLVSGQAQRIKRREQQEAATGMAGAERLHTQDVGVALEAVNTQLANMASSAKLAEAAIGGLNSAMGLIQQAGQKLNEPGGWFDRGKKQFESEKRDFETVGGAVAAVLDFDKRVSDAGRSWLETRTPFGRGSPNYNARVGGGPRPADGDRAWPPSPAAVPYSPGGPNATYAPATTSWADFFNTRATRLGGRRAATPSFAAPEVSDTMTFGTGAPGDKRSMSVAVEGTVHGESKLTIEINAPTLLEIVRRAEAVIKLSGQVGGTNGTGSTGKSSPDAQAPGGTGFNGVW